MTRLRECREDANLSQKYVALTLGIAAPSVANWERGKTNPSHDNIVKLADLYGVSVDYLLGRTEEPRGADEVAVTDIEFALHDEIRELSENGKKDLFKFARFIHEQEMKAKAAHDD